MTYTLAHELWHATSKHWIFNQLFEVTGPREFLLAIAGDETVASLLSLTVRKEVKRDRLGFFENAEDFIDSMKFIDQFNALARINPHLAGIWTKWYPPERKKTPCDALTSQT